MHSFTNHLQNKFFYVLFPVFMQFIFIWYSASNSISSCVLSSSSSTFCSFSTISCLLIQLRNTMDSYLQSSRNYRRHLHRVIQSHKQVNINQPFCNRLVKAEAEFAPHFYSPKSIPSLQKYPQCEVIFAVGLKLNINNAEQH